ncbi:hypothetical protein ACFXKG_21025 [Streptomyces sp. NPDC059255]|uniref:hypothetical protein n=1 Tax=Streptomyces sp. NPDC059255 TaxID=3346793 RepID=UPI0036B3F2FB
MAPGTKALIDRTPQGDIDLDQSHRAVPEGSGRPQLVALVRAGTLVERGHLAGRTAGLAAYGLSTMTDHHTYGTNTHTASELVRLISDCLSLVFTERESDYRGIYHVADSPDGQIEIQPNLIPGDAGEDDFYAPEHPAIQVLLLTTTPVPVPTLLACLGSIDGLIRLYHESW